MQALLKDSGKDNKVRHTMGKVATRVLQKAESEVPDHG
jgi:hypothetical protein